MRHRAVHAPLCLNRAHVGGGHENLDEQAAERPSSDTVSSAGVSRENLDGPARLGFVIMAQRSGKQGAGDEKLG